MPADSPPIAVSPRERELIPQKALPSQDRFKRHTLTVFPPYNNAINFAPLHKRNLPHQAAGETFLLHHTCSGSQRDQNDPAIPMPLAHPQPQLATVDYHPFREAFLVDTPPCSPEGRTFVGDDYVVVRSPRVISPLFPDDPVLTPRANQLKSIPRDVTPVRGDDCIEAVRSPGVISPLFPDDPVLTPRANQRIPRDVTPVQLQTPPAERTESHIVTNSRGLRRTATPAEGWPRVYLLSSPWENVADTQVEAWKEVTSPKLWVRVFRGKYESNSLDITDKTRAIIKNLVSVESDLSLGVSFPLQKSPIGNDRFPNPYHMLISGLSNEQVEYITSLEVVSTTKITLLFTPFEEPRPEFVATICGLTLQNSEEATQVLMALIRKRFQCSKEVIQHLTDCSPLPQEEALAEILGAITVSFIEVKRSTANGGDFRGWNVYLRNSSLNDQDHIQLIKILRACTYPTPAFGFGIPLRGQDTLLCVNCKSIDHNTPNCPFPKIPGWLGFKPPPQSTGNPKNAYVGEMGNYLEGGSHPRGRGRGRGNWNKGRSGYQRGGRGFRL